MRLTPSRLLLIAFAMSAVAARGAFAQRPSFAGRWIAAPDTTGARGRGATPVGCPGSGWGSSITITQDGGRLSVEVPFFGRYDMQPPLRFVYALDGTETKNTVMLGQGFQEQRSRTTWNGPMLVITTVHAVANPAGTDDSLRIEVTRRLSLESPTRFVVETTPAVA